MGRLCNLCGFALPKDPQANSSVEKEEATSKNSMRSLGFLVLGVVAFFGWLVFMGSQIWGSATSWMVISMPPERFADSSGRGLLAQYKLTIIGFSAAMLGASSYGFFKFLKK